MVQCRRLAELLACVAAECEAAKALDILAQAALEFSRSRNVMLALIDDEQGHMELLHGAGAEWSGLAGRGVTVDVNMRDGIVSYVAVTGRPYVSGDVRKDARYRLLFESTVSEIAIPIRDRAGRIRAVLNAESDRADAYGDEEIGACEVIAQLCANVLERDLGAKHEQALVMVGNALDSARSEDELLSMVVRVAREVLRFQACSIFLWDSASQSYVLRASVGSLADRVGHISYRGGEGCTGWVCETGQTIRLDSPMGDARWRGKFTEFPSEQIASFIAVPILGRARTIGVIRVIRRRGENEYLDTRFTDEDQVVLQAIAEQVASGLENIRSTDKLLQSERMAAWGELSAKSSHMIGNRVFALKGGINELEYQLSKAEPDLSEVRSLQASLRTNVDRIEEILQDFRDFVTATNLSKVLTDVNRIVSETASEVFPKRSNVKLELTLEPDLPMIEADPLRLRRAVSELIENSLNWAQEGGLHVDTKWATSETVTRAHMSPARRYVAITVQDSGPGVAADKKETIFQPFHSGRVKGMGLGLSIVKGIAEAHHGTAIEDGIEGQGARFVVLLPGPIRQNAEKE